MVKFRRRKIFRALTLLTLSTLAPRTLAAKPKVGVLLPSDLGVLPDKYFLGYEGFYIFRAILKAIIPPFSVFAEYEKVVFLSTENILRECLAKRELVAISKSIAEVNNRSLSEFHSAFYHLADANKKIILTGVERDLRFRDALKLVKKMALHCFFTSEYGATKKLRYAPVPGSFIGSVKLKKGDSAWAE